MDFDLAAKRLQSDQENLRGRSRARNASRKLASSSASEKARRAEQYRQKQREKKAAEERLKTKKLHTAKHVMHLTEKKHIGGVERYLKTDMGPDGNGVVTLKAVSVHGEGDKITLPPSVLATLAERNLLRGSSRNDDIVAQQQPLFFRLGIKKKGYVFPQSLSMKRVIEKVDMDIDREAADIEEGNEVDEADDDNEDGEWNKAYLDELNEEYLSYTYVSVVEFSQEEGHVGLPLSVAQALLHVRKENSAIDSDNNGNDRILESHVTVDPALAASSTESQGNQDMDCDDNNNEQSQTPGHVAYGLFPVPTADIEVSLLLRHLPLGTKCTLRPTHDAVRNGFYSLKNIKIALEQSLIGTRSCLNVRDVVPCWFRGKKYELGVVALEPKVVGAVSCINCDVEVVIADEEGEKEIEKDEKMETDIQAKRETAARTTSPRTSTNESPSISSQQRMIRKLPPEPLPDQVENVIDVQIRGVKGSGVSRRRFDDGNLVANLFDFAVNEGLDTGGENDSIDARLFKLVTRFPRRVLLQNDTRTLRELGLGKQEMFLVEK